MSARARKWFALWAVAALALLPAGCGLGGSMRGARGNPYTGTVTYWFWGESDAPGATTWIRLMAARYERLHPAVHINIVPQGTDTLIGAFRTAAETGSGPDIATQWATLPTLTPAWTGASVPISSLVPASEIRNWIGTEENRSARAVWAMPIYLLGAPFVWNRTLFKRAGLSPDRPPATWQELLQACSKLRAAGITPIVMGNKDGYAGAWFFSMYGRQSLDSIDELKRAMLGRVDFGSTRLSGFYTALADLVHHNCFNNDIASLDLNQGWQLFPAGKGAMAWTTDGNALQWEHAMGANSIGVGQTPILGSGALARWYDTTQSSDAFITSWSKHQAAAAAFLVWLHQPDNLEAWYRSTGVFPADKRFRVSQVRDPIARQLFALDTQLPGVWPENYLPPQVDQNADLPAGEGITSGSGDPQTAVALWRRVIGQWREQHPHEWQQYAQWTGL
jgi:ABC-type glycerol-3-phosphate transport system substrate-binding protein